MNRRPMLKRMLLREKDAEPAAFAAGEKVRIGFVGMSAGAGVSLMAFAAARHIAGAVKRSPALVELSDGNEDACGWNYDAIGIERRFADRRYVSFYRNVVECRNVKNLANMDEGINWVLRIPAEIEFAPDLQQMTSLVNNAAGDVTLCDFSARLSLGGTDEDSRLNALKRLLQEMTLLVFVIDPLPSKLLGGHRRLALIKELEAGGQSVFYLINKFGRGVNKRELYNYLKPRDKAAVGQLPADELCEAEFTCKNPYQMPGVKRELAGVMEALLDRAGLTP